MCEISMYEACMRSPGACLVWHLDVWLNSAFNCSQLGTSHMRRAGVFGLCFTHVQITRKFKSTPVFLFPQWKESSDLDSRSMHCGCVSTRCPGLRKNELSGSIFISSVHHVAGGPWRIRARELHHPAREVGVPVRCSMPILGYT